ncbi:MAG TPA: hypothetical protein DCS93_38455 [Microscillaceae bacterium]|nr:hypothetical protein [Microscillaceae bacterium]
MQRSKFYNLTRLWSLLCLLCLISPQLLAQSALSVKDSIAITSPEGIAILADGSFYVTDLGSNKIRKYDNTGTFVSEFGGPGATDGLFNGPTGIAVDSQGNIFVTDRSNNRVQKFNSSGTFVKVIGTTTASTANGDFNNPVGIAIDAANNVYVVDRFNDRVQKLTNDGVFIKNIGMAGTADGQFGAPYGIILDSDANLYVTDTGNDNVQKFDSTGTFLSKFGVSGTGNGEFQSPLGIALDAQKNVYVSDVANDKILIFNSSFTFLSNLTTHRTLTSADFLAFNANGELYITDRNLGQVYIYTTPREINVKAGTTNLASNSTRDFGNVNVGSSSGDVTFTIENLGGFDLTLNGTAGSLVVLSGTNAADFTVTQTNVTSPIAGFSNKTFTVSLNPSATGTRTAALTIMSNDADEGTYTINLTGNGANPEINVKAGTTDVASGGTYDFGSVQSGQSSADVTFTIENTGNGMLTLSGTAGSLVAVSGTNAADFTVTQTNVTSPVAGNGNVTFTVKYTAGTTVGAASAVLTITSNDADEGTYTVNLTGTATSSVTSLPNTLTTGKLKIGPNPATDRVKIMVSGQASTDISYQIVDLQGRVVSTGNGKAQNGALTLNLSQLGKGNYVVIFNIGNQIVSRRLQKQ